MPAAARATERRVDVPAVAAPATRSVWRGAVTRLERGLRGAGVALTLALCPVIYGWAAVVFSFPLTHGALGVAEQAARPLAAAGAVGGFAFAVHVLSSVGVRLRHQGVVLLAALAAAAASGWCAPRQEVVTAIVAGFFGGAALAGAWVLPASSWYDAQAGS